MKVAEQHARKDIGKAPAVRDQLEYVQQLSAAFAVSVATVLSRPRAMLHFYRDLGCFLCGVLG